jgi:hypothetical protein
MMFQSRLDPAKAVGRAPERLTLDEAIAFAGRFNPLAVYTPETRPLRRIEAIGETAEDCIRELAARGLNPARHEISRLKPPF